MMYPHVLCMWYKPISAEKQEFKFTKVESY